MAKILLINMDLDHKCVKIAQNTAKYIKSRLPFLSKVSEDPKFYCNQCGAFSAYNFVDSVEKDVYHHMSEDNPASEQMIDLVKACVSTLHEQHYLVMMLKDHFILKKTDEVEILEKQEEYAKDVLLYLQILDPGKTWRKSQIVQRLRAITTALVKKKADKQEIDTATLKSSLRTIQDLSQAIHKLW